LVPILLQKSLMASAIYDLLARPPATGGRRMCGVSVDHRPVASVGNRSKAIGFNEAAAISPSS
jgi:hypothetical protein